MWETSRNKLKKASVTKIVLTFHCFNKLFLPFTVLTNCSCDFKIFANSWPVASNFKSFSRSLEHFFLTVGQDNFGNKIPFCWELLIRIGPTNNIIGFILVFSLLPHLCYISTYVLLLDRKCCVFWSVDHRT